MTSDFITDDLDYGGLHEDGRLLEAAEQGRGHDLVQQMINHSLQQHWRVSNSSLYYFRHSKERDIEGK